MAARRLSRARGIWQAHRLGVGPRVAAWKRSGQVGDGGARAAATIRNRHANAIATIGLGEMFVRSSLARLRGLVSRRAFREHPARYLWRRIRYEAHWVISPRRQFVVPFYGGLRCRLARSDASLGIYLNAGFSAAEIAEEFIRTLKPGMVAVDCGSHIGEYTLLFAALVGPTGSVHAFEPDARMAAYLRENVRLNGLSNVTVTTTALSDYDGEGRFILHEDATASSLEDLASNDGIGVTTVKVMRLDSYAEAAGLERVDAVKINVEGAAETLIAGGRRFFSRFRPALVHVECDGSASAATVADMLEELGLSTEIRTSHYRFPHVIARGSAG